jgi:hypothetical protein
MQTAKSVTFDKKAGHGTLLADRQPALRMRPRNLLQIVKANQQKAQSSLRIKLAD